MQTAIVRPVAPADPEQWRPLWDGYNAFYGRSGPTALAQDIAEKPGFLIDRQVLA